MVISVGLVIGGAAVVGIGVGCGVIRAAAVSGVGIRLKWSLIYQVKQGAGTMGSCSSV